MSKHLQKSWGVRRVYALGCFALVLASGAMAENTQPDSAMVYQLSDLDRASAAPVQIVSHSPLLVSVPTPAVELAASSTLDAAISSASTTADMPSMELVAKTTLSPGITIDGLACNILHTPTGKHRWSILQYDLSIDTENQKAVFVADEERVIQSMDCSEDGSQVLMAFQDSIGGDSEVYLIDQTNHETQRLTDNETEDLDVSMSQDGRIISWQGRLADNREAVFVRTIAEDGSYTDVALGSKFPFTQPSLSNNGGWLTLVNERNRYDYIMRYQVSTGEFTTVKIINSKRYEVTSPSISDDGNKVLWAQAEDDQQLILIDLTTQVTEELVTLDHSEGYGLNHPMLSGDAKTVMYSINAPAKRQTFLRVLLTGETFRLGKVVRAENQYLGNQLNAVTDIATYRLNITAENGRVIVSPESQDGYLPGESMTLTAEADSGFAFESWSALGGECSDTQSVCTFEMPQSDVDISANFRVVEKLKAIGIAAGNLALLEDGKIVSWDIGKSDGLLSYVQLPDGSEDAVIQIASSGSDHTVALKSDGTVVGWGSYTTAIGWGDSPTGVVQVVTGADVTLMLFNDGTVEAYGAIGAAPEGLDNVISVAAGYEHGLALKSDGTVVNWGNSHVGAPPEPLSDVVAVSALDWHAMVLKSDGTIINWGNENSFFGSTVPPEELNDVVAIAGAGYYPVALREDGSIVTWRSGVLRVLWAGDGEIVALTPDLALKSDGSIIWLGVSNSYSEDGNIPPELAED